MPANDLLGDLIQGSTGYICVICENPLILTLEATCKHKFCSYCITLWKKYHPLCPICSHEIRSLRQRHDIDDIIERFFSTADAGMKLERQETIAKRAKNNELTVIPSTGQEMNSLIDQLKPPGADLKAPSSIASRGNTATGSSSGPDKKKDILRLLRDTARFEEQLNVVYSKIVATGERLTSREDQAVARLCAGPIETAIEELVNSKPSLEKNTLRTGRPHTCMDPVRNYTSNLNLRQAGTALDMEGGIVSFSGQKPPKEQADIDTLIELTDDALRIDHFLKTFNFDTLTEGGSLESDCYFDGDVSVLNGESQSTTTLHPLDELDESPYIDANVNFKIHPEVQKYLDKCALKIKPRNPIVKKSNASNSQRPQTAINPRNERCLAGSYGEHCAPVIQAQSSISHKNKSASTNVMTKIVECRQSLLNLKEKAELEALPKITFKPINSPGDHGDNEENPAFQPLVAVDCHANPVTRLPGDAGHGAAPPILRGLPSHNTSTGHMETQSLSRYQRNANPTKLGTFSVSSLPSIVSRQGDKKKGVGIATRIRPQTTTECKKRSGCYVLPRPG